MKILLKKHRWWVLPLLGMALLTPFTPWLDLGLSHFYYDTDNHFQQSSLFSFLYNYGILPGQIAFGASAILLFLSCFFKRWKKWYAPALAMVLTLAIGSGLIIHATLKDHWGRPRPKQVIEFGGAQQFRPYYSPNFTHQPEPSKSFPCGHCSMGFYFFALALIALQRDNRPLFISALTFAFGLGFLLSWARIAQGGHFLSDTIVSGLIMWLTAYACVQVAYSFKERQ